MANRRLPPFAAWLAALSTAVPALLVAQALPRALYVSIVDQNGNRVPDLGPSDFIVREDKVAREVLRVGPATDPMQIAVLVDNSQAAEPFIRDYREALPAFLAALTAENEAGRKNEVALITLGERPTIVSDYTTSVEPLIKGAQRIFSTSGSGTYLLDGIIETSKGLIKREASRPVIVAITSEGPELSDRVYQAVLEPLKKSGAAFHVVVLGTPRNMTHDRAVVLDQGTRDTGGRYDTLLVSTALNVRLKQVADDLMHQYKVTYARPQTLIPPEQVTVAAAKPGLTARGTVMKEVREPAR